MTEDSRSFHGRPVSSLDLPDVPSASRTRGLSLPDVIERRIAPRSVALEYRSWLGWRDGDRFVAVAARLVDISRAGAAVVAEDAPPPDREIWFCLHSDDPATAVEGEVVGVGTGVRGRYLIRISFWEPCPDRLYKMAIHGKRHTTAESMSAVS